MSITRSACVRRGHIDWRVEERIIASPPASCSRISSYILPQAQISSTCVWTLWCAPLLLASLLIVGVGTPCIYDLRTNLFALVNKGVAVDRLANIRGPWRPPSVPR